MVKRLKCGSGNCYVVNNGKDAILIDTGKKEYLNQIIKECKPYTMRLIVLTHVHIDHAENAEELSNIWERERYILDMENLRVIERL